MIGRPSEFNLAWKGYRNYIFVTLDQMIIKIYQEIHLQNVCFWKDVALLFKMMYNISWRKVIIGCLDVVLKLGNMVIRLARPDTNRFITDQIKAQITSSLTIDSTLFRFNFYDE